MAGVALSIIDVNNFLDEIGISMERKFDDEECCGSWFYQGWIEVGN